jgi:hypothetical protein
MDILLESFSSLSNILSKFQNMKSPLGHVMTNELKAQLSVLSACVLTQLNVIQNFNNNKNRTIGETMAETEIRQLKNQLAMLQRCKSSFTS